MVKNERLKMRWMQTKVGTMQSGQSSEYKRKRNTTVGRLIKISCRVSKVKLAARTWCPYTSKLPPVCHLERLAENVVVVL